MENKFGNCPKCKSNNLKVEKIIYEEDDGEIIDLDDYNAHCNDCGFDFTIAII